MTGDLFPMKPTEKSIMLGIKQALSFKGWTVIRMPPSIYSGKGLADLYAIRHGISVWIEVKSPKGNLSRDQVWFGKRIEQAGGIYVVARSVDYAVECCENVLISMCAKNGDVGQTIRPAKGMRLMVDGK